MIIANLATYPARQTALKEAVRRLAPQVDQLNVILNEYGEVPSWMAEYSNVHAIIPDEDYKDIGKFVPRPDPESILLLVDDDLLYPDDYVSHMISEALRAGIFDGMGAIGGLHGTHYRRLTKGLTLRNLAGAVIRRKFRVGSFRKTWDFWRALDEAMRVDQIGTGTAILPARLLPDLDFMRDGKRLADVKLGQWAYQNGVPMVALPRPDAWLVAKEQEETIYSSFTSQMPKSLSREISQFAFKIEGSGRPWTV